MANLQSLVNSLSEKLNLTRRGFVKGTLALGAAASLYGCSKGDGEGETVYTGGGAGVTEEDLTADLIRHGTSGHNCGGKCLITAHVKNGRILRFATDETDADIDSSNRNNIASRACAKCRAYKGRLYHPGRLKYPLKQTKKRGDLSGFVRITWDQALKEISLKHKAITDKYGTESFFLNYACGAYSSTWQGGGYTGLWSGFGRNSIPGRLLGGYTPYAIDYSFHQNSFLSTKYTGYRGSATPTTSNEVASVLKNLVQFGSNILSTVNPNAYPMIRGVEEMKVRGGKAWFIGPEFVDGGVTLADEWIQSKPYTDGALINAMIYHMIVSTFNSDGSLITNTQGPKLDLDYLDTMVYGFFDSPAYWLNKATGNISLAEQTDTGWSKVEAVPAGKSLSAYIMGSDDRLTKAPYGISQNYTAQQFKAGDTSRNLSVCSYVATKGADTQYQTKKDFLTPKSPAWAEKITGIPASKIEELANLYLDEANHPIFTEWSGGQLKQANGCATMFAIQSLLVITKTWGQTGDGLGRGFGKTTSAPVGAFTVPDGREKIAENPATPIPSCTMWHNGVKFAFSEQLKAGGYDAKFIPDWSAEDQIKGIYFDDAGTKSLLRWDRDEKGVPKEEGGFFVPKKDDDGQIIKAGMRFILNPGGNILINQHMNSNDSRQMFESLPIAATDPTDPDTLCVVSIDNFLSPTPRWSDYVLPAATTWEQEDIISITNGNGLYIPVVSAPPGQSKSMWNFTNDWLSAYEKIDTSKAGIAVKFTGDNTPGMQIEDKVKKSFVSASADTTSPYFRKTWKEFLNNPYLPRIATTVNTMVVTKSDLRIALDTYLTSNAIDTTPFIKTGVTWIGTALTSDNSLGAQYGSTADAPAVPGRMQVYSDMLVWQYENRYSKWHGHLPSAERGQANKDIEGDKLVEPIAMYYAYEDYFKEAYGVLNGKGELPANPLLLTTTHDRYRAHSSQAENPYLRELTHRTIGGKLYSGNDWKEYALIGEGKGDIFPRLNQAIAERRATATYSEIWMNIEDGAERGIVDGDLVQVENRIGAVRVIARLTNRCVRGFLGLHQGCWYDPAEDGVDDGGNCNTLMASRPSRMDHGNGQQSAMVSVRKI